MTRVLLCTSAILVAACAQEPVRIDLGHEHGRIPDAETLTPEVVEESEGYEPVHNIDTAVAYEPPDLIEVRQRGTWMQIAATVPRPRQLRVGQRRIQVPEGTWQAMFAMDWMDACNVADTIEVELGNDRRMVDLKGEVSFGDWRPIHTVDPSSPPLDQYDPIVACSSLNGQHWYPAEPVERVISVSWDANLGGLEIYWDDATLGPWHLGDGFAWSTIPADVSGPLRVVNPYRWVVQRAVWQSPAPIEVQ